LNDALTIAFVFDHVDVDAGLHAAASLPDGLLLELAEEGLLGWGWDLPGEDAPERPWRDDPELVAIEQGGEVAPDVEARYLDAVRRSVDVGVRNAARLLAGEHPWFESRIVDRVPLVGGGEMLVFSDDSSNETTLSEVARLPIDVLPDVGRAMGVFGRGDVRISATIEH